MPRDTSEAAAAIDRVCIEFENEWRDGVRPDFAEALGRVADELRAELFRELLAIDLVYRRQRGETPCAAEYEAQYAEHREDIERALEAEPAAEVAFEPGEVVDRYAIERELGRGSFGTVYLANDLQLERQVAIKVPGHGRIASARDVARLIEETRTAARLQHPGIVRIYDVQPLPDQRLYAVLQYVPGQSLRAAFDERRLSASEIARLLAQVADALAYAHRQGFVHRDLSPGNILLDEQGAPHVTDFGLAVHQDDQRWRIGEQAGSWAYMAPEQVRGDVHRLDGRADLWALGVILYEGCTGRRPFAGETPDELREAILNETPRPPRQLATDMSAELERICRRCLAKEPEERFAASADLAHALRAATRPRGRGPVYLLAALFVLIAVLAIWFSRPPTSMTPSVPPVAREAVAEPTRLTLWVWRGGIWNDASRPESLPLVAGDQVRITCASSADLYYYAVWLSADGQLAALHPWRAGDWSDRAEEHASDQLHLPSGRADESWTMEPGPPGTEVLIVGSRREPLPPDVRIEEWLADLPRLPAWTVPRSVRFDYESIEVMSEPRSIDPRRKRTVDAPLLRLQAALSERLRPHFTRIDGIAVSFASDEE